MARIDREQSIELPDEDEARRREFMEQVSRHGMAVLAAMLRDRKLTDEELKKIAGGARIISFSHMAAFRANPTRERSGA